MNSEHWMARQIRLESVALGIMLAGSGQMRQQICDELSNTQVCSRSLRQALEAMKEESRKDQYERLADLLQSMGAQVGEGKSLVTCVIESVRMRSDEDIRRRLIAECLASIETESLEDVRSRLETALGFYDEVGSPGSGDSPATGEAEGEAV